MPGSHGGGFSGGGGGSFSSGSKGSTTFSTRKSFPGATHYVFINSHGVSQGFYSSVTPKRQSTKARIAIFSVIVLAIMIFAPFAANASLPSKIPASYCEATGVYLKDGAEIIADKEAFNQSMKEFYDKTGAEPYVYTLKETDFPDKVYGSVNKNSLEDYAYDKYLDIFNDEGHYMLIIVLLNDGTFLWLDMAGNDTMGLIDDEAFDVLKTNMVANLRLPEDSGAVISSSMLKMADASLVVTRGDKIGVIAIYAIFLAVIIAVICAAVGSIRQAKIINDYCDYQQRTFTKTDGFEF